MTTGEKAALVLGIAALALGLYLYAGKAMKTDSGCSGCSGWK